MEPLIEATGLVKKLWDLGLSREEIAFALEVGDHFVDRTLHDAGVVGKRGGVQVELDPHELLEIYRDEGYSLFDLSVEFDVAESTIRSHLRTLPEGREILQTRYKRRFSQTKMKSARTLFDQGSSLSEIALEFLVVPTTIKRWLVKSGLSAEEVKAMNRYRRKKRDQP